MIAVPAPYLPPQGRLNPELQRFLEGEGDFAFLSRDLSTADMATYRQAYGLDPLVIPIAGGSFRHFGFVDSVAIVVNSSNPVNSLSFAQIDAVFSSGRLRGHSKVTIWGDLGVQEWKDRPVRVVGSVAWRNEESARAIVVRDRILSADGRRGEWRTYPADEHDSEADVPLQIASDPYAIGFTGMGHLVPGIKPLALAVSDGGAPVEPSYDEVILANYPLARQLFIVLPIRPDTGVDKALIEWVHFLLGREAQDLVRQQGIFMPLREKQRATSLEQLRSYTRECSHLNSASAESADEI